MQRVQASSDAAIDLFGSGKHGYTDGSPGVIAATEVHSDQFLNPVQEEIATACERNGIALSTSDNNQLFKALFMRQARHAMVNTTMRTNGGSAITRAIAARNPNVGQVPWLINVGASGSINSTGDSVTGDGTTWTARTAAGAYSGNFQGVYADQDGCMAVGASGEIQTSPDSVTWTHRTAAASFAGTFYAVTRSLSSGLYVIVGSSGEIQTSTNGSAWTHRTAAASFAGTFYGASWSPEYDRFVIVGTDGEIQTSSDGITWTHRSSASAVNVSLSAVTCPPYTIGNSGAYGAGPIVAVGSISGSVTEDMLYYSIDGGVTWARGTRPGSIPMDSQFLAVSCSYAPGEDGAPVTYYVAVGLAGRCLVSANGRNWMDASQNKFQPFLFNCVTCDRGTGTVYSAGTATLLLQSQVI